MAPASYFPWPLAWSAASVAPGDRVAVLLTSTAKATGVVTGSVAANDGRRRVAVRLENGNGVMHVRPARVVPKLEAQSDGQCRVLVCPDTPTFRKLVQASCDQRDRVVEIGSSWGRCTSIIGKLGVESVVGVDSSAEGIEASRQRYPHIRFEQLDCLKELERLRSIAEDATKVFVDVGGDRSLDVLAALLPFVEDELRPAEIVVKSRELHASAVAHGRCSSDAFAEVLLAPLPHVSAWRAHLSEVARSNIQLTTGRETDFTLHPRRYSARHAPGGVLICRYHNFRTCAKGSRCDFDHAHCNVCGEQGHTARSCDHLTYFGQGGLH